MIQIIFAVNNMNKKPRQNKVSVKDLLSLIPEVHISKIADKTKVNYYTKILDGKSLLYLILYSLIEQKRNSLRSMEDIFNSLQFKFLFNLDPSKTVKYNSISERLSVINLDFFENCYSLFYETYSKLYTEEEQFNHKLIRVDSTMVAETANKIKEGMVVGNKPKSGERPKQIKYTMGFDGLLPCDAKLYNTQECLSENKTIAPVIFNSATHNPKAIYTFDRGVQKRESFTKMHEKKISFVSKLKLDTRYKELSSNSLEKDTVVGRIKIESDSIVQLGIPKRRGFLPHKFRLLVTNNLKNNKKSYVLTNIFDLKPEKIITIYKRRWDIEVFFRFLKQELNFKHLGATSTNGIKVMMYSTLIASMLVMIYKKLNNVGFKTAVRRISFELNELIIAMIVKQCGGDPALFFR